MRYSPRNMVFVCKRLVIDGKWFNSLNDKRIVLFTLPLTHVHEDRVTLGPIRESQTAQDAKVSANSTEVVRADVIILANGFDTLNWFHRLEVIGRNSSVPRRSFQ
ncbi:hypothetical protein VC83_02746 [Pseudogymnoascus destructans]|uniref:Uncharacterized protein n=2 Tax=Pseudogymnoascus destructans TaxID=655981 RepID=L8GBC1_PSED2|nr:uncharacterized protein VC83_02746 [Pseudogymnoascus destructans]ELR09336.1 hypothetical protein GMDG_03902 [Pseudogymnoascus destructans 20631-21]OAF61164.1 hypothetical protein VC83_02746 [Pseudogymnoascus destructans]